MSKLDHKGEAFSWLVIEVFRLNRLLLDAGDVLTRPAGLSSARWQVLGVVENEPVTVANVARTMGLTRQTVQQTADGLANDELIEFIPNPHHRRAMLMQLTPKGQKALDYVEPRQADWANALAKKYSLRELQAALALLQKVSLDLAQRTNDESPAASRKGGP